jgi:hypothetical protein
MLVPLLRRLWWLPPIVAAAISAGVGARGEDPIDIPLFLGSADALFSADWLDTFAQPQLQVGPLLLVALGLCDVLAAAIDVPPLALVAFVVEVGVVALLMLVVGRVLSGRPARRWAQLGAGLIAVATGIVHGAYADGHPAQLIVPLLWVLAATDARDGRELRAGALIGLSGGLELWGVLGAPVLLLGRPRRALGGLVVEGALLGALFAPFVVAGDFRMFEYRWLVTEGTLATLFLDRGEAFSWPMRLLQASAAVGAAAGIACWLRQSRQAVWAVPIAAVCVRVALDPSLNSWYLQGVVTLAIVGAASVLGGEYLAELWRRRRPTPSSA